MSQKAHEHPNSEDLDTDLTDADFAAMEANLAAMENHLFNAGVAILQASKTQEDIFQTSMEAIQEALEPGSPEAQTPVQSLAYQVANDSDQSISLATIWARLNTIEQRLEYLIEHLIPTSKMLDTTQPPRFSMVESTRIESSESPDGEWTEKSLKKAYKTLAGVRAELGIAAKNWKSAVQEANAMKPV
ncbi:MAG: hypothetical protein NW220_10015 [Leptolyngbyaceae cyanobacterium bins.349]|nr:hypothetical protein [Leptolyngbyaceae cyanobacterium bins.349]